MAIMRTLKKITVAYLLATGVLAHLAAIAGFFVVLNYFQLTPSQFLIKAANKVGLDSAPLLAALSPPARYADHVMDGRIREAHPRILLPQLAQWSGVGASQTMQQRATLYRNYNLLAYPPCEDKSVPGLAACWAATADPAVADALIAKLRTFDLQTPDVVGQYGNGWALALGYDLVATYPGLSADDRAYIETLIERALVDYLVVLDDPAPSLWHGRTTLAASAWLCAVALAPQTERRRALIARAQGHFLDVVRAAELTEAWPEGYNYWIQNRAFLFVLAAGAYINGLEQAREIERIRALLRRVGLWHVYATRPDNRIEGFGDEGSRLDLKDETRRVIDLIAQFTRDPVFAIYSRYLEHLHSRESYYRDYRWGFWLFNDPTVKGSEAPVRDLAALDALLPKAELFGRGAFNVAYMRSGWSPEDTFISFRAGDSFTHHGHYDAGHFTLFKAAPLAVNSSTYGGFMRPHRLYYAMRTVAKNGLVVLRPGEKVQPNRVFEQNVADGGQRLVLPTGSALQSTAEWYENRDAGLHLAGAKLLRYDAGREDYTYISADLTAAYNHPEHDEGGSGGKVSQVIRELVYLRDQDRLVVHDRVASTDASYTKKWLLHTIDRPRIEGLAAKKGTLDNGIMESRADYAAIGNGNGFLAVKRVYPDDAVMRLVGGPDYQFYVEADGDDADLDGTNFSDGASFKPWFEPAMWRIEIQPSQPRKRDEYLVVLTPGGDRSPDSVERIALGNSKAKAVAMDDAMVIFANGEAKATLEFVLPSLQTVYIFGVPPKRAVTLHMADFSVTRQANDHGVVTLRLQQRRSGTPGSLRW